MAALTERGTHYVARVRNNAVLKRLGSRTWTPWSGMR